jgi:hypothetical protein
LAALLPLSVTGFSHLPPGVPPAEFTIAATGSDFYDISIINGVNVPMSFGPAAGGVAPTPSPSPYWCGAPGAATGPVPSNWSLQPPSPYYVWVLAGGAPCTSDADCSGVGTVCGVR